MPKYHQHLMKRAESLIKDTQKSIESRFHSPAASSQDSFDDCSINGGKSFF